MITRLRSPADVERSIIDGYTAHPLNSAEKTHTHTHPCLLKRLFLSYVQKQRNGFANPSLKSHLQGLGGRSGDWGRVGMRPKVGVLSTPFLYIQSLAFTVPFPKLYVSTQLATLGSRAGVAELKSKD